MREIDKFFLFVISLIIFSFHKLEKLSSICVKKKKIRISNNTEIKKEEEIIFEIFIINPPPLQFLSREAIN